MKDDNQHSPQFRRPVRVPLGLRIRFDTDPTCYSSFVSRPQTHERKTRAAPKATSLASRVTNADHKSPSHSDTESELIKHREQLPTMLPSPASQNAPICCVDLCESKNEVNDHPIIDVLSRRLLKSTLPKEIHIYLPNSTDRKRGRIHVTLKPAESQNERRRL